MKGVLHNNSFSKRRQGHVDVIHRLELEYMLFLLLPSCIYWEGLVADVSCAPFQFQLTPDDLFHASQLSIQIFL